MTNQDGERIDRLSERIGKCAREVERLRRDVQALTRRITDTDTHPPLEEPRLYTEGIRSLDEAFEAINRFRDQIRACEMHLNAIRASFDTRSAGAVPREEMEPHSKLRNR
jgi:uncharacterized protein (DUF342 family)